MFFLVLFYFDFSKIEDFDYLSVSTTGLQPKVKKFFRFSALVKKKKQPETKLSAAVTCGCKFTSIW